MSYPRCLEQSNEVGRLRIKRKHSLVIVQRAVREDQFVGHPMPRDHFSTSSAEGREIWVVGTHNRRVSLPRHVQQVEELILRHYGEVPFGVFLQKVPDPRF